MQNTSVQARFRCPLTQAKHLGGNYFLITMIAPPEFRFKAGQHLSFYFEDQEGVFERYYSIANAPNPENQIQFCIVMVEDRVTKILEKLKVGDFMNISAARGTFTLRNSNGKHVLIAGGSGISPIRGFFQQLTENFTAPSMQRLHLIYGCKHANFIPGKEEFLDYHQKHGANLGLWITAEGGGYDGVKQGGILSHLEDAKMDDADYYMCGPAGMLVAVTEKLEKLGVSPSRIFREVY